MASGSAVWAEALKTDADDRSKASAAFRTIGIMNPWCWPRRTNTIVSQLCHRLGEVVRNLVEEAGRGQPALVGADQEREVLGHAALLDGSVVSALAQEHVVRGVGHAFIGARLVASAIELSTHRVDPLHCRHRTENAAAAPGSHSELQPGNVVRDHPRGGADDLADHRAAVAVLPVRSGIMPS